VQGGPEDDLHIIKSRYRARKDWRLG